MNNYKIIFSDKVVCACTLTNSKFPIDFRTNMFYVEDARKEHVMYAVIKAESEITARVKAETLIASYYGSQKLMPGMNS